MPELFGNPYLLPAIVVVVLLLVLLLLFAARRRKAPGPKVTPARQRPVTPPQKPTPKLVSKPAPGDGAGLTRVTPVAAGPATTGGSEASAGAFSQPGSSMGFTPEQSSENGTPIDAGKPLLGTTVPLVGGENGAETRHAHASVAHGGAAPVGAPKSTPAATPGTAALDDPVRAVIMDILHGWGDLGDEDLKRLGVFRPEKVLAEVDAIGVPKDLKTSEHASLRLGRIREHASKLVKQETVSVSKVAAQAEEPAAGVGSESAVAAVPNPTGVEPGEPGPRSLELVKTEEPAFTPPPPSPWAGIHTPEPPVPLTRIGADQPPTHEEQAEEEQVEAEELTSWTDEIEGWTITPSVAPTRIPIWPDEVSTVEEELGEASVEAASAESEAQMEVAPASDEEESLSVLHGRIRTASDLMALPADQRLEMLVFLEPSQLSQVFEAADDPALKKGVIDSLEHLGNPAALGVLRQCLDDPNPEIQLYALEAADRMLGVD